DRGSKSDLIWSLNAALPWAAQIHKPPLWLLGSLTPSAEEVLRIVQRSAVMCAGLDAVRDIWLPDCVIHGDIKADNILVDVRDGNCADLRIVDWEMVQRGDPAWDAAGFVQELVVTWLRQFARIDGNALDTAIAHAKLPLPVIQRAIQRFWWSYVDHAQAPKEGWSAFSTKLAHHVGVRMIQTTYEATMNSSAVSAPVVLALQISENILADPGDAARSFLGLVGKDEY
ncbi:MAG TPA: phosphotransferase, partial [Gemmataceae bacterium]|nr:phosphotransferase [Gemmataceae bacterium]